MDQRDKIGRFVKGIKVWDMVLSGVMPMPWNKGKKMSNEFKEKLKISHLGQVPWNKNTKGICKPNNGSFKNGQESWNKGLTKETDKRVLESSKKRTGLKRTKETIKKMSLSKKGKPCTFIKNKFKIGDIRLIGKNNFNWKGGITHKNRRLRASSMWKSWRKAVFLRDKFTCQNPNCPLCHNEIGHFLHPHHIKAFSTYPELRFDINNGITYCKDFHLKSGLHKNIKYQRMGAD